MKLRALSLLTLALAAANAQAITIRDDVAASDYTALGNDARYNSVGSVQVQYQGNWIGICSATLLSNDLLATAGNCNQYAGILPYRFVAAPASLNNTSSPQTQTIAISQFYTHPDAANPVGLDKNLGLLRLSAPISTDASSVIRPAPLDMSLNPVGQVGTFIGYGQTGTGLTGDTNSNPLRYGAQNMIDSAGAALIDPGTSLPAVFSSDHLMVDFDQPGNPSASATGGNTPLALEGAPGRGDSGGGLFVNANGSEYLVGIAVNSLPNNAGNFGQYGYSSGFLNLSSPGVRNFIAQTAPELGISTVMDATPVHSLSDSFTGVTVGDAVQQNNQIGWVPSSLFGYSDVLGPEDFYSFQVQTSGDITFTVTPGNAAYDTAIYLLENGVLGTDAVAGADAFGGGIAESFTYHVVAGRQYYFAVDGRASAADPANWASGQGPYTFTMSGDAQLVPEPATLSLLAIGAVAAVRRRRGGKA